MEERGLLGRIVRKITGPVNAAADRIDGSVKSAADSIKSASRSGIEGVANKLSSTGRQVYDFTITQSHLENEIRARDTALYAAYKVHGGRTKEFEDMLAGHGLTEEQFRADILPHFKKVT